MKLGFTGTREKLADAQIIALRAWLEANRPTEFHHGACLGADATAALQVKAIYGRSVRLIARPGNMPKYASQPALDVSDERHPPVYTLTRNKSIVENTDLLLACPSGPEVLRSGTWSSIRWARKLGRRVIIVWPDGRVEDSADVKTEVDG